MQTATKRIRPTIRIVNLTVTLFYMTLAAMAAAPVLASDNGAAESAQVSTVRHRACGTDCGNGIAPVNVRHRACTGGCREAQRNIPVPSEPNDGVGVIKDSGASVVAASTVRARACTGSCLVRP